MFEILNLLKFITLLLSNLFEVRKTSQFLIAQLPSCSQTPLNLRKLVKLLTLNYHTNLKLISL